MDRSCPAFCAALPADADPHPVTTLPATLAAAMNAANFFIVPIVFFIDFPSVFILVLTLFVYVYKLVLQVN